MAYQIIARKYRPKSFSELIGQDRTITIIKNSIERNKLGHAYLFSGPRGVGKTTLARILVKCLNCENGVTTTPCGECGSCVGVQDGKSLDYEEIDGASNRGIDQIREINQSLAYSSPSGKHRVFVIDEVHMLTIEAFNALLKSLEEPPAKTVFVLCTTEKYKIPMTIRSRCQQFQFDRVTIQLIESHLKKILDSEKINYQESAIFPIAKKSDGSVRDGENLLEQAIAYCLGSEGITMEAVIDIIGEMSSETKFTFIKYLLENRLDSNQTLIHELSLQGVNFEQFLYDLNEVFTAVIYHHSGIDEGKWLEFSNDDWSKVGELRRQFSLDELFLITDLIYEFIKELRTTTYERVSIYYFLVKLHRYKKLISLEELKENITHLAKYYVQSDEGLVPKTSEDKEGKMTETKLNNTKQIQEIETESVIEQVEEEKLEKITEPLSNQSKQPTAEIVGESASTEEDNYQYNKRVMEEYTAKNKEV